MTKAKSLESRVITAGLAVLTAFTLNCCAMQKQPEKTETKTVTASMIAKEKKQVKPVLRTFEKYAFNIEYYDFSKIPFETIPQEEIEVPKDMNYQFEGSKPRILSKESFEKIVLEEAAKLGYSGADFKNLECQEAVKLAMNITAQRMTPFYVDEDTEFIKKHGKYREHEHYFKIGLGDCDKYAYIAIGIFDLIKKDNPNLKNVYLSNSDFGGNFQTHQWNSLLILKKDSIILSHIDPIFYDGKNKRLEADGYHINLNHKLFLGRFYRAVMDYEVSFEIYKNAFEKSNKKEKEDICEDMSDIALLAGSVDKIRWVEQQYYKNNLKKGLDKILYNYHDTLKKAGLEEEALKKKEELLEKFPYSYWTNLLKTE